MSLQIQGTSALDAMSSRAEECRLQIMQLRDSLMETSLTLGRLLREARDNHYHQEWGFQRFGDWVEEASGLDMSERQSYYLMAVVERAEQLGIPDEDLNKVKLSKLKTIFSLPEDTDPDVIKGLVKNAEESSLKSIQEAVGVLKDQDFVYTTLKFDREAYENVWLPAIERARREYGNTIGFSGNLADIEQSRAAELLAANFLAEPEEFPVDDSDILEADFEDYVLEPGALFGE